MARSAKQSAIDTGYLVLADISGFTPFVASSEIEHAQGIHRNLIDQLRRHLTPALTLAEIEGDALFLYASTPRLNRGETLLELIESTYVAFRDRIRMMHRNAVCPCQACRMIPTLDLKFIVHWGEYVVQSMGGAAKPFGSCVNLAHRLLKNEVTEETGWNAYALFTEQAVDRMGVRLTDTHQATVAYPHLGPCTISAVDLHARYGELTAARRSFLDDGKAHFVIRRRYPLPRSRVWELITDVEKRNVWEFNSDWVARDRPAGRSGPGATNHCAASDFMEELLDWRPFDYFTTQLSYRAIRFRVTGELLEDGDTTEVTWRIALESVLPAPLRGPACRFFAKRLMRAPARFERLDALVRADTGDEAFAASPSA